MNILIKYKCQMYKKYDNDDLNAYKEHIINNFNLNIYKFSYIKLNKDTKFKYNQVNA